MKKNIFTIIVILCILTLIGVTGIYMQKDKKLSKKTTSCGSDKSGIDSYASQVLKESATYLVKETELDRQATDSSYRKIFTDKNNDVVLIEDKHSGESGFRIVEVIIRDEKVEKIIDTLTSYEIPPIVDSDSNPTITKDEFYVENSKICAWYKMGKFVDHDSDKEQYLDVVDWIIDDAETIATSME